MSDPKLHPSVRVVWNLAHRQAVRSGSDRVEPAHFFTALLLVMDDLFHQDAELLGLTPEQIAGVGELAREARERMGLIPEDLTRLRRRLTSQPQAASQAVREETRSEPLHRSERAHGLFDLAHEFLTRTGEPTLTLVHLLDAALAYPSPDLAGVVPGRSQEKPDLAWETRVNRFVDQFQLSRITIVMTDIEGSTAIKSRFGDVDAARIFRAHDNVIRKALEEENGREIKSTGDGFLLGFAEEEQAVRFALKVQARLRTDQRLAQVPVRIRMGIHAGEILSRIVVGSGTSDPVFGITIDTAARIMSLGGGNQVITDRSVWSAAALAVSEQPPEGIGKVRWECHGRYELKGVSEPVEIWEVGEEGAATFTAPAMGEKARPVGDEVAGAVSEGLGHPGAPPPPVPRSGGLRISSTPGIDLFGRDLTALARAGSLPPFVGRRELIKRVARHLQRTVKRNVMVVGDAGVGKSAVVEGFALWAASDGAPDFARKLRVVQIAVADLVSGARYRGDMEERVQGLLKEATENPDVVLFLDEIHLVFSGSDGGMNVANLLKPALAREDFRCIGATTTDEFERYVGKDAAFARRFQLVRVPEPTEGEALEILRSWAKRISEVQEVDFTDQALEAAVRLSALLLRGRALPDKAIDLLENVATHIKVSTLSPDASAPSKARPVVGTAVVEAVLEEEYGVTASAAAGLRPDEVARLLQERLVGQDQAVEHITRVLAACGGREGADRPLAVLLFTGPTGVGKTWTAECLAEALTGPGSPGLCRLNMSELTERHDLSRLTGAPPGFVGHDEPGALFRHLQSHPQGVLLLDEMEKAHSEVHDYFLQVFDKGEALDQRGRIADFRHQVVVMTANVLAAGERAVGFAGEEEDRRADESNDDQAGAVRARLLERFRAEFLGRIDGVIPFRALDASDYSVLVERRWDELVRRASSGAAPGVTITDAARVCLVRQAVDRGEGVRGFDRIFEERVRAPVLLAAATRVPPVDLTVDVVDGELQVEATA